MKTRAVSSLLASLAVVSFILPAVAAPLDDQQAGSTPSIDPSSIVATVEAASQSAIRLDGVPQQSVEYQIRNGVTYITVRSFVSMLDPAATVEEANGVVTVSSARVEQVVDALSLCEGWHYHVEQLHCRSRSGAGPGVQPGCGL